MIFDHYNLKSNNINYLYFYSLMNKYTSQLQSEQVMIDHIKFIAHDLFEKNSPIKSTKKNTFQFHESPIKPFLGKSFEKRNKTIQQSNYQTPQKKKQQKNRESTNYATNEQKIKQLPLFSNFQEFCETCKKRKFHQIKTPIIEKINKNIYGKFKQESNNIKNLIQSNLISRQDNQHLWEDFLNREHQWRKQKQAKKRSIIIKNMANQNNNRQNRTKTFKYEDQHDQVNQQQMTQVQQDIQQLKMQTQKLRLKILGMENKYKEQQPSKRILPKTFNNNR